MKLKSLLHKLLIPLVFIYLFAIMLVALKGSFGQGLDQASALTQPGQAFESSISRGRYALVLSLAHLGKWDLPQKYADFGAPDVAFSKNGFVSIFPPAVALILVPFYLLGSLANIGQLAASFAIILFAFINCLLIYALGRNLKFSQWTSAIASVLFLLASNALTYTSFISQHQVTTFILLASISITFMKRSIIKHLLFWALYGASLLIDWPNIVLLFPAALHLIFADILVLEQLNEKIRIRFVYWYVLLVFIIALPVGFYGYYNLRSSGNPMTFGQILPRFKGPNQPIKVSSSSGSLALPFDVKRMPSGLNVLLFGTERGILFYFPVFLLSIFGIATLYKISKPKTYVLVATVICNLLLYSMFGDVWGGWAFGPRYLIPSFAILALFVALALFTYKKKVLFLLLFVSTSVFSISTSALGSLTTTLIPPIGEAGSLGLDPNITLAISHVKQVPLGSFVYNQYLQTLITPVNFYICVVILNLLLIIFCYLNILKEK